MLTDKEDRIVQAALMNPQMTEALIVRALKQDAAQNCWRRRCRATRSGSIAMRSRLRCWAKKIRPSPAWSRLLPTCRYKLSVTC